MLFQGTFEDLITKDLCERCLVHRLAFYLQMFLPDFYVDCEFNKSFYKDRVDKITMDRDRDRENLRILTAPDRFVYFLGFYIILGRTYEETKIELYVNGGLIKEIDLGDQ